MCTPITFLHLLNSEIILEPLQVKKNTLVRPNSDSKDPL